jgi:cytochrome c-type biogenesis protein CcmH/NrfG
MRLDPDNQEVVKQAADTLFRDSGAVGPEAAELYRRAYELDPTDLRMGYLAGVGDWQAGRRAEAEALWADIEAKTPAGDPRAQMFQALRETFAPESLTAE